MRHPGWIKAGAAAGAAMTLVAALVVVPRLRPPRHRGPFWFDDVTGKTGITFVHTDGSSGRRYIIEPMSAGLALFDYDGDGDMDVYFLNGAPLPGTETDQAPTNALWRNDGHWRFTDVTRQAGVADPGYGLGVVAGDYDNDGDADLYLNNYGHNVLYRNNGDGTFTDVTGAAGVAGADIVGAGAAFLDADADGDLDLYVANYLHFDADSHVQRMVDGMAHYPSPRDFLPVPDTFYRNNGDGTFTDISAESGIASCAGTGMGMVCADYDADGDTDVFVLNDVAENFFFVNDGTGRFQESGLVVGAAYNAFGDENASMGVDCGDFDNDGLLDFFMTSYQDELPVLYRNTGGGFLEDVTRQTGAGSGAYPHVNWGTALADFDNDGDLDLFVANGHTEDNIELFDRNSAYRAPNQVLVNRGDGHFTDVSETAGPGLRPVHSSRGAAFDDLDGDGDIDAVVLNSRQPPTVLRNDTQNDNHWIQIRLEGVKANRDGVGARVRVVAGTLVQIREVHAGRSYQSHFGTRLHFGLGHHTRIDRVEIRWIGGGVDILHNLDVDRQLVVAEGKPAPTLQEPR